MGVLDKLDLSLRLERAEYEKQLDSLQRELSRRAVKLFEKKRTAVLVFEGKDAGGKGGAIKRVTRALIPQLYSVLPIAAPSEPERARHYLWRFAARLPEPGRLAIFDRSWYGRVLVERVEGFAKSEEWKRAYREINEMERRWHEDGVLIAKFWLQISQEEQVRRFEARAESPLKNWKLTDEDWRNREKWPLYAEAVEAMIERTSTPHALWHLVEGDDKLFARIKVLRTVSELLKKL